MENLKIYEETLLLTDGELLYKHVGYNQYLCITRHFKDGIECIHLPIGGEGLKPFYKKEESNLQETDVERMSDRREKGVFY